jgi:DedD protein
MALFKSRKKKGDEPRAAGPAESIEVMRRRARHRLIGAVVLVLVGVIGFPLLFDTQPRPVAVDIPIEIPDRNKVQPLPVPPAGVVTGKVTQEAAPAPAAPAVQQQAAAAPKPAAEKAEKAESQVAAVEAKPAKPEPAPEKKEKAQARPEPRPAAKAEAGDDGAKARALLNGKTVDTAAAGGRYVVQVGAFADASKARDARLRVERAGLKTYTNVAETKEGRRIRVRAGPFSSRAEADKAAEKIKGLDLPAAILTL